jgi:hypothetical protein
VSRSISALPFRNSGTTVAETVTGRLKAADPLVPDFEAGEATMLMEALKSWEGVVFGSKVKVSVKSFLAPGLNEKLLSEKEYVKWLAKA